MLPKNLKGGARPKGAKILSEAMPYMEGNEIEPKANNSRKNEIKKHKIEY